MNIYDIAVAKKMSGGGGGGSSDFTTATVTVVNNEGELSVSGAIVCIEANLMGEGSPAVVLPTTMISSGTNTLKAPLYKGACLWDGSGFGEHTISGNIQDLNGMLLITGDCTITVGNK